MALQRVRDGKLRERVGSLKPSLAYLAGVNKTYRDVAMVCARGYITPAAKKEWAANARSAHRSFMRIFQMEAM